MIKLNCLIQITLVCFFSQLTSCEPSSSSAPEICSCPILGNNTIICVDKKCTSIPDVDWSTVREAILRDNQISEILLKPAPVLEALDLTNNNIRTLNSSTFFQAKNLTKLLLADNRLTNESVKVESIWDLKKLQHYSLAGNKIGNLDEPNIFQNIRTSLLYMDLSRNNIEAMNHNAINDLEALIELDLSYNRIAKLDSTHLMGLKNLKALKLSNNYLSSLPSNFIHGCNAIVTLDLSHNSLYEVEEDAFFQATYTLQEIQLHHNLIKTIPQKLLSFHSLKIINLDNNPLVQIDSPSPFGSSLLSISIQNCNALKQLQSGLLQNSPLVERVDIANNVKLQIIEEFTLPDTPLEKRKKYRLANNSLSNLPMYLIPWSNSTLINLEGNSWFCDCNIAWMLKYTFAEQIVCYMPIHYKSHKLIEFEAVALPCTFVERHRVEAAIFTALGFTAIFIAFLACMVRRNGHHLRRMVGDNKVGRYETLYSQNEAASPADSTDAEVIRLKDGERDIGEEV